MAAGSDERRQDGRKLRQRGGVSLIEQAHSVVMDEVSSPTVSEVKSGCRVAGGT